MFWFCAEHNTGSSLHRLKIRAVTFVNGSDMAYWLPEEGRNLDELNAEASTSALVGLVELNPQLVFAERAALLDPIAEAMLFVALSAAPSIVLCSSLSMVAIAALVSLTTGHPGVPRRSLPVTRGGHNRDNFLYSPPSATRLGQCRFLWECVSPLTHWCSFSTLRQVRTKLLTRQNWVFMIFPIYPPPFLGGGRKRRAEAETAVEGGSDALRPMRTWSALSAAPPFSKTVRSPVLLSDKKPRQHWIFHAWGAIGADIGGSKEEHFVSLDAAVQHFPDCFP
ncbi:poly (ADP ribose) polymerase [Echinococcus multilocularis]|uniref:Poly (ADP ribose) polymerase n=1 Tax=Echinococcus multilocularis TaxID=6211 RepID=A0A0S4MMB8_ECHMU|nr:poly (ADP ribose) polymerase [Echinococcus multilocularis]